MNNVADRTAPVALIEQIKGHLAELDNARERFTEAFGDVQTHEDAKMLDGIAVEMRQICQEKIEATVDALCDYLENTEGK